MNPDTSIGMPAKDYQQMSDKNERRNNTRNRITVRTATKSDEVKISPEGQVAGEIKKEERKRRRSFTIVRKALKQDDEAESTFQCRPHISHAQEPPNDKGMPMVHSTFKPNREQWNSYEARIIAVPADGLCMYHCVHVAQDPHWMRHRNESGMAFHT